MHLTKIALIVEYDGSRFHGFQLQPQSPTVQEELELAVYRLTRETVRVHCASRTDAGVHALGQVVSFRTAAAYPAKTYFGALNFYLPEDVRVLEAHRIPMDYDIRRRATSRRYRYAILNRPAASPILRGRSHWVPASVNVERMSEAAKLLLGRRDFAPFCGPQIKKGAGTVRDLVRAEFRRKGEYILFEVEGSSFLPQQVRRMAGALLQVGLGKQSLASFQAVASSTERGAAGPTAHPQGLYLIEVRYRDFQRLDDNCVTSEQVQE